MSILTIDVETTTKNKGDPFNPSNRLCTVGMLHDQRGYKDFSIEYDSDPYGQKLQEIQQEIDKADILIGFNFKFDLHWLRRYGISFVNKRIWDCQLVHFILNYQQVPYPALNDVAASHGLGQKIDIIKEEYWNKGIDTPDIPLDILLEYQEQDVQLTYQVYQKQVELVKERGIQALCLLHNMDLLMLEEMEWNGMKYDSTSSIKEGDEIEKQIEELDSGVKRYWPELPINLSSPDHISAILYGGVVRWKEREEFLFTYKDSKKEPVWKSKIVEKAVQVDRQVEPLKGTESKKEGNFSTDEDTLRSLKARGVAKKIIASLLERRGLEKLRGTYLHGIPKKIIEAEWEDSLIHGNLNQTRVITGRLSSDKPNLQNMDKLVKKFFRSRK